MNQSKPSLDDLRIERKPSTGTGPSIALWIIVLLVLLLAIAGGVWWLKRPGAIEVHTAVARQETAAGSEHVVLNASGYVTARRQATVSSKVTGKVIEVLVEEGMKVEAGQVLARIDSLNVP